VVNAGSTSLKLALVDVRADGTARTIARNARPVDDGDPRAALREGRAELGPEARAADAVGHRVVHGGTRFAALVRVDDVVESELEALRPLAPLHNPPALAALRVARALWPERPMVAVFDTAFHATRPPEARHPALPWELVERHGLWNHGFHGIAHGSLLASLARARGEPEHALDAVTLQLGGGCSACALAGGRSVETSMGFSPLGGLPMATRCGDLDPGLLLELLRQGHDRASLEALLGERSGLRGLAGSADLRQVLAAEARGDERARLAVALLVRRLVLLVGGYLTLLGGRGELVFGGGIGTHSAPLRQRVLEGLAAWGFDLDRHANARGAPGRITRPGARAAWVFETDEETPIARAVCEVLLGERG